MIHLNPFKKVCAIAVAVAFTLSANSAIAEGWPTAGGDILNSRHAKSEKNINRGNVKKLQVKWVYDNLPPDAAECSDNALGSNLGVASVTSTPSVDEDTIYFSDWCGYVTALNKEDPSDVRWRRNMLADISAEIEQKFGVYIRLQYSRNTPAIAGDKLLIGNGFFLQAPLCLTQKALNIAAGGQPHYPATDQQLTEFPTGAVYDPLLKGANSRPGNIWSCHEGHGAIVVALDKATGAVEWYQVVSDHPAAKVTGSISVDGDTAYVPVGGWEEEWTRLYPNVFDLSAVDSDPQSPSFGKSYPAYVEFKDPANIDPNEAYPCCSSRGKVVALDISDGSLKWEKYLSIGADLDDELDPKIKDLLPEEGFWGVSTYGHSMPIDKERERVYVATAETYNAPKIVEECEIARRETGEPDPVIPGLPDPAGSCVEGEQGCYDSCNDLSPAFKTYGNAIVALDANDGSVEWSFFSRQYDAWVHACASPDFNLSDVVPVIYPDPIANMGNCPELVGPDYGFGHQPILIRDVRVDGKKRDIVVAGQKDGRLFALDADTGKELESWASKNPEHSGIKVGPSSIYGGMQFGISSDGKNIYVGITNSDNTQRDIQAPFVSAEDFLDINFNDRPFSEYPGPVLRTAPHVAYDGAPAELRPGPGHMVPFLGPGDTAFGSIMALFGSPTNGALYPVDYPQFDDNNDIIGPNTPLQTGPRSGPRNLWALVRPPSDSRVDCVNTFASDVAYNRDDPSPFIASCKAKYEGWNARRLGRAGKTMYTLSGIVSAVRAKDGTILWQRPAIDSIEGEIAASWVHGSTTVANGVVYVGYGDARGTLVALNSQNGRLLWKFNAKDALSEQPSGRVETSPSVVDGVVYWGIGAGTLGPYFSSNPNRNGDDPTFNGNTRAAGNRVYAFDLEKKEKKKPKKNKNHKKHK